MALSITFQGQTIYRAGAYSLTRVSDSATSLAQLGVVALIGEAEEGEQIAATTSVDAVTFTPDQFGSIVEKFGSGYLVDNAKLAINPSNDADIFGGAQTIICLKTNASTRASLALASSYGTVYAKKYGAPGNLTSVTITGASTTRVITLERADLGITEVGTVGNVAVLTIQNTDAGSSAGVMSITATHITTTITGGSSSNLSLRKADFATIQDVVNYINTFTNYTASVATAAEAQSSPDVLDRVTGVDIKTAAYTVKRDAYDVAQFFAESQLVTFTQTTYAGLPAAVAKTFMSGGAKGATTNAHVQTALDFLKKTNANFVVPLFSRDATSDITDGLTDASSTYTFDSITAALRSHLIEMGNIKGRKERQGFVGFDGTFANAKIKAAAIASGLIALNFQRVDAVGASGSLATQKPHTTAAMIAGMMAGSVVGLSPLYKSVNISGISTAASDFDPDADGESAIKANLMFLEKDPNGGFRVGNFASTYGRTDRNWYWSRPAVVYASFVASRSIRLNLEAFIGKRNSDVSPTSVENFLSTVCDSLRASGILVATAANKGRGYTAISARLEGNVYRVSVTLTLVEAVEFVLADLTVVRAS